MNLYRIEYSIISNGQRIICHSVGENQDDVVQDIMSVVGKITILDVSFICDIHRISGSIKNRSFRIHRKHRPDQGLDDQGNMK
jgi:hypothetical protein